MVPIVKRENASGGVHGIEGQLELDLDRRWSLFAWVAWARGELTFDQGRGSFDEPLDRVPPLNGLAGVRYTGADEQWYAQLGLRWATRQDRLGAADRNDPAICPASGSSTGGLCRGTPAFAALDIHGAARLHRMLRLTLALQNLTNESYRLHGAALDAPGVSASLGLELLVR